MNEEEYALAMQDTQYKLDIENKRSLLNRGRAITCGTCFNGMVEILIRGEGDRHLWVCLSPQEVGEIIHQLASTIGCTAAIQPRNDFLNYRNWQKNKLKE